MAISIVDSKVYPNAGQTYAASHQLPDLAASGTDTYVIAAGYNRNPASYVSSWTIEGNTPTNIQDNINANVVAISVKGYVINNAATTVISNTPSFKLQNMIGLALTGVDQTTPITGTPVTFSDFNTNAIASYTGTAGNLLLVWVSTQGQKTFTASGCTAIATAVNSDSNIGNGWVGYAVATGSAQTIGATFSGADNLRVTIIEIQASTPSTGITVTPSIATLTTTGYAPTVTASANQVVTPGTLSLIDTMYIPVILVSNHQVVTPNTVALITTKFIPAVNLSNNQSVTPPIATLILTTFAPTVTATANQSLVPSTVSLVLTGFSPTVTTGNNVAFTPATQTLTLTGYAPTVTITANQSVTPATATLVTTKFVPSVNITNHQVVTPNVVSLTTTKFAPTVTASNHQSVTPVNATLVLTPFAPTVVIPTSIIVAPPVRNLVLTPYAPIVNYSVPARKYYIDSDANIYWVVNQSVGLVEKI